jgi:hypothetical protein
MKWALNEKGMRIYANDYDLRFESFHLNRSKQKMPKFFAPCCHAPVTLVQSQLNVRPYFRHPKYSPCEFAQNNEYLESLHWEIADRIEELYNLPKSWVGFIKKIESLSLFHKLRLKKIQSINREQILHRKNITKRADIKLDNLIVEIQCSHISVEEIKERIQFYSYYPNKIRWILGIPEHKPFSVHIEFPAYANEIIKSRFKEQAHKYRKFKQNRSRTDFYLEVLVLNRWQTYLIQNKQVLAFYHHGYFYPKFRYGEIYTAVNPLEFQGACRKIRFVIFDQKVKF